MGNLNTPEALLGGLTDAQREAVRHTEGPLLVLAAAGSGKTRVITRRIAYLIQACGIPPWQILALTFTNKAAAEMRERVHHLLVGEGQDPRTSRLTRGLTVTTFHALCARLLRRYAEAAQLADLKPNFTIYDTADQTALMKRTLSDLGLSTTNWPPRSLLGAISNAKNELLDAEAFEKQAGDFYSKQLSRIYTAYTKGMRSAGAIDFDDLLLLTARMLRERAEIREECAERWQYLLIDEYQDTNKAQFEIARLLCQRPSREGEAAAVPNVCVVGDPDQSIYGWRGADISNILEFEEQFPSCRTIMLGENFRSTEPILAIADGLIKRNKRRKDKPLFTSRPGGEPATVVMCRDERHEAQLVADWLRALHDGTFEDDAGASPGAAGGEEPGDRYAWKDMAIFYRTNALSRVVEDALRGEGIPYVIARGTAFYQREEVKNALAYLRVVANEADDVSLARILNVPTRGIGKTTQSACERQAAQRGVPLMEAVRAAAAGRVPDVTDRARPALQRFVEMIDGFTGAGSFMGEDVSGSLADLVERVVKDSGLEAHYKKLAEKTGADADEDRLGNLDELISSAREFEESYDPADDPVAFPGARADRGGTPASGPGGAEDDDPFGGLDLAMEQAAEDEQLGAPPPPDPFRDLGMPPLLAMLRAYLESVSLIADADTVDPEQGAVTLMTLHAAKGLEFGAVAMIGLEEGVLPHSRAFESEAELEEERRLAFVGITRAMRRLHITSAKYRTHRGMAERAVASRFLEELDRDHCVFSDQSEEDPFNDYGSHDPYDQGVGATPWDDAFGGGAGRQDDLAARLEAARAKRRAFDAAAAGAVQGEFPPGCRVRHPQFGEGRVISVSGGLHARAEVEFKGIGKKTLVLEYARLKRIG